MRIDTEPQAQRSRETRIGLVMYGGVSLAVYINGSFSGSFEVLQSIPASEVFSVDRIGASDAAVRFGPKHNSGALLVRLVRHD